MRLKKILALLMAPACLSLGACRDELPLNRRIIVQNAGVDVEAGEYMLSVNAFIADRSGAGEEDNGSDAFFCRSGSSVTNAMENVALLTGRQPYFPHNQAVVVGRKTAEQGIGPALSFFTEYFECRGSVPLFIADTTAAELLECAGQDGNVPARELGELGGTGSESGRLLYTEVFEAAQCMTDEERDFCVPMLHLEDAGDGETKRITAGDTALFSGDRMVAVLNEEQTRGVRFAAGDVATSSVAVEVEGFGGVAVAVMAARTGVRCADNGAIALTVECECQPFEWNFAAGANPGEAFYRAVAERCEETIRGWIEQAIGVCAVERGCDPFGFGRRMRQQQPDWWRANGSQWKDLLPGLSYDVEVRINLRQNEASLAQATGK